MKKYIKLLLIVLILFTIFITIFFISRKMSLNNYLNKTDENSKKINYTTNIVLNINNSVNNSNIEYQIIRSSYIKKISINNYTNDNPITDMVELNTIHKYIVTKGDKKGSYTYDNGKYNKTDDIKEDFNIDYNLLKDKIKSIKDVDNVVISDISYKKYIVKMKSYDAYNFIYSDEILSKEDLNDYVDVEIYIDKSNNFVYKIKYEIDNLNNSDDDSNSLNYSVEITNIDINNNNEIKLPF